MTMRPLGALLPVDEALATLLGTCEPIADVEGVPLDRATGRVLAQDLVSPLSVPPFHRAAMDGYALRAADAGAAPVRLQRIETVYAGGMPRLTVHSGQCTEIATGAPLPEGADAVLRVEDTRAQGDDIDILVPVRPGQCVTRRGADIEAGQRILSCGTLLNPSRVGAVAAAGHARVSVYRRPRIKVAATGNEIVEPGMTVHPGQLFNVNAYTLTALLTEAGCVVERLPVLPDDVRSLKTAILESLDADVVVICGGSSVGVKDLMIDAVGSLGEVLFHGVAIKPGKPTMLGRVQGRPVIGMPGYPTSCLSNGYIFLLPLVARLGHQPRPAARRQSMPLVARIQSEPGKVQVYTVRVQDGQAQPVFKESGVITSMSNADGYILIPAETTELEAGTTVEVVYF